MASSRHLTRLGEGPMAQTHTGTGRIRRQNLEYMRKAHRRWQSWHQRLARAGLRTKQRLWFCQIPDSPDNSCYAPSTNESDEDDFGYGAFIDRANQRDQVPKRAHGPWSQTDQSWQGHRQYFGWETLARLVVPINVPQLAVVTLIQKDRSQETDGHN